MLGVNNQLLNTTPNANSTDVSKHVAFLHACIRYNNCTLSNSLIILGVNNSV